MTGADHAGRGTALSRALSALRRDAGLRQTQVVDALKAIDPTIKFSQAELSRAERGRSVPDPEGYLPVLLQVYGADPGTRERVVAMASAIRPETVRARAVLAQGSWHFQQRIRDIEDQSEGVRSFHPSTVLGVLQTESYARAVWHEYDAAEAEQAVEVRLARGRALLDGSTREWTLIHTEGALRWNFAGGTVMADQMDHIAGMIRRAGPHVRVGVIPSMTPVAVQPLHGFHIYDLPAGGYRVDERMAQIGTHTGTALLGQTDADVLAAVFTHLEHAAVFGSEAAELVERIAQEYRALA